jgi:predicted amidohydrolase YtcJ
MSSGVPLAAGSDCPMDDPDPFVGIQESVLRDEFVPEEAISVHAALKTYTINAAYAAFEEDVKGSIEEEKLADIIILDKNPLDVPKDQIKDIKVLETIIRGKTVYTHKLSASLDLKFG